MLEALGRRRVVAVRDLQFAAVVAVVLELQHDALQSTVLPAGLAENIQFADLARLPDDPDAQHPRHSGHGGLHPAIAGQIRQRFQREEQVGSFIKQVEQSKKYLEQNGISCSVGVSWCYNINDVDELIKEADTKMYENKANFYENEMVGIES